MTDQKWPFQNQRIFVFVFDHWIIQCDFTPKNYIIYFCIFVQLDGSWSWDDERKEKGWPKFGWRRNFGRWMKKEEEEGGGDEDDWWTSAGKGAKVRRKGRKDPAEDPLPGIVRFGIRDWTNGWMNGEQILHSSPPPLFTLFSLPLISLSSLPLLSIYLSFSLCPRLAYLSLLSNASLSALTHDHFYPPFSLDHPYHWSSLITIYFSLPIFS